MSASPDNHVFASEMSFGVTQNPQRASVVDIEDLSHDTRRIRLELPDSGAVLGLGIGFHLKAFCPNPARHTITMHAIVRRLILRRRTCFTDAFSCHGSDACAVRTPSIGVRRRGTTTRRRSTKSAFARAMPCGLVVHHQKARRRTPRLRR